MNKQFKRLIIGLLAGVTVLGVAATGAGLISARAAWGQPAPVPEAPAPKAPAPEAPPPPIAEAPAPAPEAPPPQTEPSPQPVPKPEPPRPQPRPTPPPPPDSGPWRPVYRTVSQNPEVVLTFDDGPTAITGALLDLLEAEEIPAAFFWLAGAKDIALAEELVARGHQLGSHTITHPRLTLMDQAAQRAEIARSVELLEAASGAPITLFRPPFAAYDQQTRQVADGLGLDFIMWSVDSRDWEATSVTQIVDTVMAKVTPGAIILLHERPLTLEALPTLIQALRDAGYSFTLIPRPNL